MQILDVSSESWIMLHAQWVARTGCMPKWLVPSYPWLFLSCVFSRFHMRGRQSSFTRGPRGSTHREHWDAAWAVESCLPFSSDTQCPWLLQILSIPGSASKPTKLRGGAPHAASKFHKNFEFLTVLPIFFQLIPESYLNLPFAGCSSCSTSGTLGDGRSWSFRVQQDVFSFAVERKSFISVKVFKPRSSKG